MIFPTTFSIAIMWLQVLLSKVGGGGSQILANRGGCYSDHAIILMAVGHPSINQCSNIRLTPIRQPIVGWPCGRERTVRWNSSWKCRYGGHGGFPKRSRRHSRIVCKSVLHSAGSGAKSINMFWASGTPWVSEDLLIFSTSRTNKWSTWARQRRA